MRLPQFKTPKKGRGLGYQGAKRVVSHTIADIIEADFVGNSIFIQEDKEKVFLDAFGGGGSMSCEFIMRGWQVRYNELNPEIYSVFKFVLSENIDLPSLVLTRAEFLHIKDKAEKTPLDTLKLIVNSFGNNKKDYLFSKEIEEEKVALSRRILADNPKGFINYKQNPIYKARIKELGEKGFERMEQLQRLQQLQQLERLQQLQQLQQLQYYNLDYKDFIKQHRNPNAVLYCDIPYRNTNGYGLDFCHEEFYEFILNEKNNFHSIYISEYNMPSYFTEVANLKKTSTLQSGTHQATAKTERLFKV